MPTPHFSIAKLRGTQTRRVRCATGMHEFQAGTRQSFRIAPTFDDWVLNYTRLTLAEANTFRAFVLARKGDYDNTWDVTLDAVYANMVFDQSTFEMRESPGWPTLYDARVNVRQTISHRSYPTSGGAYPTFFTSAISQLPYVKKQNFYTAKNDLESGVHLAYPFYANGLSGFPTRELFSWELTYACLDDVDCALLVDHFVANSGRFGKFTFTDPDDSVAYAKVHYAEDVLEREYLLKNCSRVVVKLEETN